MRYIRSGMIRFPPAALRSIALHRKSKFYFAVPPKQVASHFGGTRQGMAISWPNRIKDTGGIRHQFHHVIDIVPTILEAAGIDAPLQVDGIAQKPIEGTSMAYLFDKANAGKPSTRTTQYFEMLGMRALYHEGWMASTTPFERPGTSPRQPPKDIVNGVQWEPYDVTKDWTQFDDIAAANPAELNELQDLFWVEAKKYQVLPLDASGFTRVITQRPSIIAGRTEFNYATPVTGILPGNEPNMLNKSYVITADVTSRAGGGEGVLVTDGGRFGGYGLYVLKGKPVLLYNLVGLTRFAGRVNRRSRSASTASPSTSTTMALGSGKAGREC